MRSDGIKLAVRCTVFSRYETGLTGSLPGRAGPHRM